LRAISTFTSARPRSSVISPDRFASIPAGDIARFVVGNGSDAYRFHLRGEGASWNPFLTCLKAYTDDNPEQILQDTWYQWCKQENLWLEVIPPAECRRGGLEVHIEQRSTGRIALVEFDLDADAREAGCYTV
jgi:hypothetical protein